MRNSVIEHRFVQTLLLIVAQVVVFNNVHFGIYAIPLLLPLYVIWASLSTNRIWLMISAFLLGLVSDVFAGTLGVNMLCLTTIAMMQKEMLKRFITKDMDEDVIPHWKSLHFGAYFTYLCILFLVHHTLFYILEDFSLAHITDTVLSILSSFAISVVIALIIDYGRGKRL